VSVDWTTTLDEATARAIAALISDAIAADGTAPVSEQAMHTLGEKSDARHGIVRDEGTVVGYTNLVPAHGGHPAMAEVVVGPDHRGGGIGTTLVAAALAEGGDGARVWAHGDLPAAKAVASKLDLKPARELLQMRRPLAVDLPELVVPEGITLRTYVDSGDDAAILRVNSAAFARHPEQGGWTEHDVDVRRRSDWFDPAGLFLATDPDGTLLGFHWTKVHAGTDGTDEPPIGEVYVVGIDPGAQGRGLGRLLTLAGLHYLRERGLGAVLLYTEADNTAAVHTYERLGFTRYHVDVAYTAR